MMAVNVILKLEPSRASRVPALRLSSIIYSWLIPNPYIQSMIVLTLSLLFLFRPMLSQ